MEQFEDAELVYRESWSCSCSSFSMVNVEQLNTDTCVTVREKFLPEDDLDTAKIKLNFAFALQV